MNNMNIWLLNPYGPIPGESWRDYSFTRMAGTLTAIGHKVVWWTSNFSHHFKKFRSEKWTDIPVNDGFIVRLVPTTGYKKNIGIGRVVRDLVFGLRAYRRGKHMTPPDCIICAESPLTFGYPGFQLARHHKCPIIFDQMDLWPEFIEKAFPAALQPFVRIMFAPVYRNRRWIYRNLDAAIALARPYLEVMLKEAPVLRSRPHEVIYNGIDVQAFRRQMSEDQDLEAELPPKQAGDVWAIFAGSLGPSYDIPTLLQVAEHLEDSSSKLKIIIAGDGPMRTQVDHYVVNKNHRRLHYAGKLPPEKLAALYKVCDIGICAYSKRSNVEMPDKIYDYTAAGLPVVNSLGGEVRQVVSEYRLGLQYNAGEPQDLLEKLEWLANDNTLREEIARNSLAIGMFYDQHIQYAKLIEIVEKLCAKRMNENHGGSFSNLTKPL